MCFSAQAPCTLDAIFPDVLHSGIRKPRTLGAAAEETIQATDDDLPTSGLRNLHTQRDAVIVGDSIVRHVRATLALIVGDFNIHVDHTNDALGLAFTDLIHSFWSQAKCHGPTHRFNHTLDLIISHGIDLTNIDILPQSGDVTDHFIESCMLHISLLILTTWLRVIVQEELLFQPLNTDSPITCLIYLNCSVYP